MLLYNIWLYLIKYTSLLFPTQSIPLRHPVVQVSHSHSDVVSNIYIFIHCILFICIQGLRPFLTAQSN